MTEAEAIAKRIESFGAGRAFTAADFSDVAGRRNAANALGRLHAKGGIARAIRGVYYVPECSALMGTEVPASADEVVRAVARANKWIVAPSGDAALNALGLDTQVPAKLVYVSSGPYKRYEYGPYDIELRHRANRDLLDCSQVTCTIVQALKALGRESAPLIPVGCGLCPCSSGFLSGRSCGFRSAWRPRLSSRPWLLRVSTGVVFASVRPTHVSAAAERVRRWLCSQGQPIRRGVERDLWSDLKLIQTGGFWLRLYGEIGRIPRRDRSYFASRSVLCGVSGRLRRRGRG